jgi:hypothetical protein
MKRPLTIILVATATMLGGLFLQSVAHAQSDGLMTEEHIARIRSNCVEAQSTLSQLHTSDALLRVNRGQLYESISTKLMTPFNGRATLNRFDVTKLVSVTADYERELTAFRANYKAYEEAMSQALKINCTNQPVAFYDSVNDARAKREIVHSNTINLKNMIQKYKDEFEALAKTIPKEVTQ